MKRFLTLLMILSLCLCLFACGDDEVPDGMKLASDTEIVDYRLFVPEGWTVVNTGNATSQAFVSDRDETRTNVLVMQWNITENTSTIDNWWELEYKPQVFGADVVTEEVIEKDKDGREGVDTILDGKAAKKYSYTGKIADGRFRYDIVACITGGSIYIVQVTYMQDPAVEGQPITFSAKETFAEDIQMILDNFRFE